LPSQPDLSLVLDLSAALCLGLVASDGRTLARRVKDQGTRGETAHALLDECLAEAGRDIADIAAVCVGVGPGSFTGIRVCAAMAQGLAFANRLPLYPFSSLAAIAVCAVGEEKRVVTAIAANAGRYFVRYSFPADNGTGSARAQDSDEADGLPEGREGLMTASGLLDLAMPESWLVTSGSVPDRERLGLAFGRCLRYEDRVDFTRIARLAKGRDPVLDGVLKPNYLMASAAEEKRRAEGSGGGAPASGVTRS
jgi:tRNA threonylcarbamoyl adenosine modification protein YeaZ